MNISLDYNHEPMDLTESIYYQKYAEKLADKYDQKRDNYNISYLEHPKKPQDKYSKQRINGKLPNTSNRKSNEIDSEKFNTEIQDLTEWQNNLVPVYETLFRNKTEGKMISKRNQDYSTSKDCHKKSLLKNTIKQDNGKDPNGCDKKPKAPIEDVFGGIDLTMVQSKQLQVQNPNKFKRDLIRISENNLSFSVPEKDMNVLMNEKKRENNSVSLINVEKVKLNQIQRSDMNAPQITNKLTKLNHKIHSITNNIYIKSDRGQSGRGKSRGSLQHRISENFKEIISMNSLKSQPKINTKSVAQSSKTSTLIYNLADALKIKSNDSNQNKQLPLNSKPKFSLNKNFTKALHQSSNCQNKFSYFSLFSLELLQELLEIGVIERKKIQDLLSETDDMLETLTAVIRMKTNLKTKGKEPSFKPDLLSEDLVEKLQQQQAIAPSTTSYNPPFLKIDTNVSVEKMVEDLSSNGKFADILLENPLITDRNLDLMKEITDNDIYNTGNIHRLKNQLNSDNFSSKFINIRIFDKSMDSKELQAPSGNRGCFTRSSNKKKFINKSYNNKSHLTDRCSDYYYYPNSNNNSRLNNKTPDIFSNEQRQIDIYNNSNQNNELAIQQKYYRVITCKEPLEKSPKTSKRRITTIGDPIFRLIRDQPNKKVLRANELVPYNLSKINLIQSFSDYNMPVR